MKSCLSRREVLALAAFAGGEHSGWGAVDRGGLVVDHFLRELDAADERRRNRLAAIQTRQEVLALQERVRRMMHGAFGALPERTPLHAEAAGEIPYADYILEKIIFQSRPEYFVTANLYRPKSTGTRRAAVVQSCGHYEEGKAKDDYQRACIGLARKGFVALIFDPMGQGERQMYRKAGEKRPAGGEHPLAGKPMLLLGRTFANYRIWDIMRAFDYLETRPDVDKTRMGLLGHSGGGMMTILTSPLEPRIRAAMSCCAVTTFYHKTRSLKLSDPEQIVPGIYANGVDHAEMLATVAPRAFLIGAVLQDTNVPLVGTRRTYQEARRIYEIMGIPERIGKVESDNVHMLDKNLREACYGWMLRHLAEDSSANTSEPQMQVETPEKLWCTKTGSVMERRPVRSVFDLNLSYSHELADRRPRTALPKDVSELLVSTAPDADIEIPSTLVESRANPEVLLILASERGRSSPYALEISRGLNEAGYSVLGVDLRGWGATAPTNPSRDKRHSWEEYLAWTAIEMGRTLLAMRVADLLEAVRRLGDRYRKVYVAGLEGAGVVALHAAAISPGIAGVATNRTLVSYRDILERPLTEEPVSSYVWRALERYDLPELGRSLAPRPYVAVDAFDSLRHPASGASPIAAAAAAHEMLKGLRLA